MRPLHAALAIGISALAAPALCETDPAHIAPVVWSQGNWHYLPVYRATASGSRVESLIAVAKPGTTTGNNLVAVWFRHDADGWHEYSWATGSREVAAESVNSYYSIPAAEFDRWTCVGVDVAGNPQTPQQEQPAPQGVLEGDPAAELVATSSDPATVLSALVAFGWQGADITTNLGIHGPDAATMLDRLSAATQVMLDGQDSPTFDPGTVPDVLVASTVPPCDPITYEATAVTTWTTPSGWGYQYETMFGLCVYHRTRCRIERRYVYTRDAACVLTVCVSSRTVCQVEEVRCSKVGGSCPATPAAGCAPTTPFTPNIPDEATDWTPSC